MKTHLTYYYLTCIVTADLRSDPSCNSPFPILTPNLSPTKKQGMKAHGGIFQIRHKGSQFMGGAHKLMFTMS